MYCIHTEYERVRPHKTGGLALNRIDDYTGWVLQEYTGTRIVLNCTRSITLLVQKCESIGRVDPIMTGACMSSVMERFWEGNTLPRECKFIGKVGPQKIDAHTCRLILEVL